jgi:hypothetical protein
MQLNDFVRKIYNKAGIYGNVTSVSSYYDKVIVCNEENQWFWGGVALDQEFSSLEEVKRYIDIQEDASLVRNQIYENISDTQVATIIKKHNSDIRVTNQLVESYIQAASSKSFTVDPIILEMRQSNKLDNLIEGKIVFKLDDGKQMALSEDTVNKIASLLNKSSDKDEIVEHMRQSQENFFSVLKLI